MSQLLVRNVEDKIVRALKRRASLHGVSTEEEHRNILREAVMSWPGFKGSLKDMLLSEENSWPVGFEVERSKDINEHRTVEF